MSTMENELPIPPTLFAEIVFLFDYDFPIEQVDSLLRLNPTASKRQSQTRINPITQKHNEGFWLFRTKAFSSFDVDPLLQLIERFLLNYSSGIHKVIQQYTPSCVLLRIRVLVQQENEHPAICFPPKILQLLSSFGASLEIDFENDFISGRWDS